MSVFLLLCAYINSAITASVVNPVIDFASPLDGYGHGRLVTIPLDSLSNYKDADKNFTTHNNITKTLLVSTYGTTELHNYFK